MCAGAYSEAYLSALLLLCLLGFESQNGVAAAQVDAALLVDVRHLDDDGITHSNNIFHPLDTLGVQLGDVDEALLARSDLDEGAEVHQTGDLALVDSTDLGVFHDGPDGEDGALCVLLVHSGDEDMAYNIRSAYVRIQVNKDY